MFADYKSYVVTSYQHKRGSATLPPRLMNPTPANLRKECLEVCKERFERKDEVILRTFFGQCNGEAEYVKAIGRFDTDKFKPLSNFLKDSKINTDSKNIELLAWLLELPFRPFDPNKNYEVMDSESVSAKQVESMNEATLVVERQKLLDDRLPVETALVRNQPAHGIRLKLIMVMIILLIVIISFATVNYFSHSQKCMYWAGERYQQISCDRNLHDTLVIALNEEKLNYFRKVTDWETITHRSIGRLWYVKVDGKIEVYTAGGYHPTKLHLPLKPITSYIINKYITDTSKVHLGSLH